MSGDRAQDQKWSRIDLTALILLFLFSLVLRLIRLFDLDVWFDEVVLLFQIKKTYIEIWNFCKTDNFPPLFPWILKAWDAVFPGENSLRVLSALLGSLTPPIAYLLGKELKNRELGWLLGVACCISAPLIYYSQMIRMYSLLTLWGSLSLFGFFRGIRTGDWKFWALMSAANLLGFYTFVTILFLIATEFMILVWVFRRTFKQILRPLLTHLPTFLLILFWLTPMLSRYHQLQGKFWLEEVSQSDLVKLWLFLGTGTDFYNRYALAFLLNMPFLLGFFAGVKTWLKTERPRTALLIFISTVTMMYLLSQFGQPVFFKRYLIFLLPLYLGLAIAGALSVSSKWQKFCLLGAISGTLLVTLGYYYLSYNEYHAEWSFPLPAAPSERGDGHAISQSAAWLDARVTREEAVIHFSSPSHRCFSFFPSVYYHKKPIPLYIYSAKEIPQHFGQQYLQPGQWIKNLAQLDPLPNGIWVVSLDLVEPLFDRSSYSGFGKGWRWVNEDNLPAELKQNGYTHKEVQSFGKIQIIHFLRPAT